MPRVLFVAEFLVLRTRQRREKRDQVIDLSLRQRQRLNVFIKPWVRYSVALVVVIQDIPQRLLRPVIEIRRSQQHISQVRRLERRDIAVVFRNEEPSKH